ncbi:MAG TPA: hemerythrin domain-containing protein [Allosphingosinicella sp.]|nr:hemerythrin domain-containing protein [Allosphingosinicella sp.]
MRSIANQNAEEMGGRGSVLARQKRDHIRLDRLLHRLDAAALDEQAPVLLDIYRLVFPHAFAEEAVLWPVIRRVLPDGHALTLQVELEHQQINALVARLETLPPASAEYRQILDRVVELLREDVRDEEDALLPRLQTRLSRAQLRLLGVAWEMVRLIAPTRAHPIVARRPPGNVLSALPLAVLDRLRDMVDARLHARPTALAGTLGRASSGLARAARAVERLPGMRSGEDPATRVPRGGRSGGGRNGWIAAATLLAVAGASAGLMGAARRRRAVALG